MRTRLLGNNLNFKNLSLYTVNFKQIFNASKVFNFGQGEFLMLGAMFYVTFSLSLKLPFILSLLCCIASMAIVGFII